MDFFFVSSGFFKDISFDFCLVEMVSSTLLKVSRFNFSTSLSFSISNGFGLVI